MLLLVNERMVEVFRHKSISRFSCDQAKRNAIDDLRVCDLAFGGEEIDVDLVPCLRKTSPEACAFPARCAPLGLSVTQKKIPAWQVDFAGLGVLCLGERELEGIV